MNKKNTPPKVLIAYYGLLQTLHLLVLIRAGILLQGGEAPFPILPPPEGWDQQSMAFMFGLAGMDVLGIIFGIFFSYKTLVKEQFMPILGILSLTIFISGAVVFGAGTFPAGAWTAHPFAYWIMAALFTPAPILFFHLVRYRLGSPGEPKY